MIALSLREPWCAACLFANGNALGPKGIENRIWSPQSKGKRPPFKVLLHAASLMTKREFIDACAWMRGIGMRAPTQAQLSPFVQLKGMLGFFEVPDSIAQPFLAQPDIEEVAHAER